MNEPAILVYLPAFMFFAAIWYKWKQLKRVRAASITGRNALALIASKSLAVLATTSTQPVKTRPGLLSRG